MITKTKPAPASVKMGNKRAAKPASATPNKKARRQEGPATSDTTYVAAWKVEETLDVLAKVYKDRKTDTKKDDEPQAEPLFETTNKVYLQIQLKKIPPNMSTFIHSVELPHHWRHDKPDGYDVCLIVKDLNKPSLADREEDLEASRDHVKKFLKAASAEHLITDVLPMRQLKFEFQSRAQKKKLAKEYDAFICDKRLLMSNYSKLSLTLGKQFWIDAKNVPVPINVRVENLKELLEAKLNRTHLYLTGKGSTLAVVVGLIEQDRAKVVANLMSVLGELKNIFSDNIGVLSLKTAASMELIFYMDLASANDLGPLTLPKKETGEQFIEDDFDMLTGKSKVRVYRDGTVKIRADRVAVEGEDDGEDNDDDDDDDEQPDDNERKLIRYVNNPRDKDQWKRHKTTQFISKRKRGHKLAGKQ